MKTVFMVTIKLHEFKKLRAMAAKYLELRRGEFYSERPDEMDEMRDWYDNEIKRVKKLSGRISKQKQPIIIDT